MKTMGWRYIVCVSVVSCSTLGAGTVASRQDPGLRIFRAAVEAEVERSASSESSAEYRFDPRPFRLYEGPHMPRSTDYIEADSVRSRRTEILESLDVRISHLLPLPDGCSSLDALPDASRDGCPDRTIVRVAFDIPSEIGQNRWRIRKIRWMLRPDGHSATIYDVVVALRRGRYEVEMEKPLTAWG